MEEQKAKQATQLAQEFINFVNEAVTNFHVIQFSRNRLKESGFIELLESEHWTLEKGGKYFFTKNSTTLFAFRVGEQFEASQTGFKLVAGHTDSPHLKLAPINKLQSYGYEQNIVQLYGGGLWHTWFDRELTLAGRIIYIDDNDQQYKYKLFHFQKPILRIPNLCIHLQSGQDAVRFGPNPEIHLRPIFSLDLQAQEIDDGNQQKKQSSASNTNINDRISVGLLNMLAEECEIKSNQVIDFDISIVDTQPAQIYGLDNDFIASPRLDNLFTSFFALKALLSEDAAVSNSPFINIICLFDHEEIGSQTSQGADSKFLQQTLKRIYVILAENSKNIEEDFLVAVSKSFIVSADMAHGIHPNYPSYHQIKHQPSLNGGIVIKTNANQRYATDGISGAIVRIICQKIGVPVQDFIVKNDSPCGSTVGPKMTSWTTVKTVDVGAPMLSMHSIRETCGVLDAYHYFTFFKGFFKHYENINQDLLSQ